MGIEIRRAMPADAAGIARVQVATWRSTYRGVIPDAYLDAMEEEPRARWWQDVIARDAGDAGSSFVVVAVDGVTLGGDAGAADGGGSGREAGSGASGDEFRAGRTGAHQVGVPLDVERRPVAKHPAGAARTLARKGDDPVATAERVVGFAAAGPERSGDPEFRGELGAIYVLEEYQGRGVGRRLVAAAVRELLARGHRSMLVWVLAQNPYRRFYETLGGTRVRTRTIAIGGVDLEEWGYGWANLEGLLRRLEGQGS
ncbi:GNAT family N-acetyltransferase [Thermaerobacter subterraneus]|uniref:Sortase-like acyltransferase n=1 Tax=Thermaerobacter subterraneus DSM 13965 TaxID=867903 RepID=K6Q211_9FIRM|nr:GNAT family N-acetyltransferase [Thermaerobacter subterraneus]EKP95233.1 sortase-like acyltransferase [Thermaerobacter subterraneus DSM 13965]